MDPLGTVKERNFKRFMAEAGDVDIIGTLYPKLQMLTVADILEGKGSRRPAL